MDNIYSGTEDHLSVVKIVTGDWLDAQVFPPMRWVVPGVIAEGLTILAGAPKLGKSWLALSLALAVASGTDALGCIDVGHPRPVLYLALEDGHRRLQFRSRQLLGDEPIPSDLHLIVKGSQLELRVALTEWLDNHRDEQPLVIVDTLAKLRPPPNKADSAYDADYRFVGGLKAIIDGVPGGGMVLVHHTNKRTDGDFIDSVSGTQGVAGAADSTITLRRSRHEETATLSVTGRDVIEAEYAITSSEGMWRLDGGDLAAARATAEQTRATAGLGDRSAAVVEFVNGRTATKAGDLAAHLGVDAKTAGTYLGRAHESGRIGKPARGIYGRVESVGSVETGKGKRATSKTSNTSNTTPTHLRVVGTWLASGEPVTPTTEGDES